MKRELKRAAFAVPDGLYRAKNRGRPRLLVYTDSRGENLVSRLGKTGYGTYVNRLRAKYQLTYALCPESHTTILDFLNFIDQQRAEDYDAIVMHCGIVDFSPRPLSGIAKLKQSKTGVPRFREMFSKNAGYYGQPFDCKYYGEPTINIYSTDFLENEVLPELMALPRFIWINANHFVPGWDGNYTRGRPSNIDQVVSKFDAVMQQHLSRIIDVKAAWTPAQVQMLTIDNVHFTKAGFDHLFDLIVDAVQGTIDQSRSGAQMIPSATTTAPQTTSR
jgi:hypothetical protein